MRILSLFLVALVGGCSAPSTSTQIAALERENKQQAETVKVLRERIAHVERERDTYKAWCKAAPVKASRYSPAARKGAEFDAIQLQGQVERIQGELEAKARMSRLRGEGLF